MPPPSRSYRDYTIGWICAVEPELIAARAMLDETHDKKLPAVDGDNNNYKFGRIGPHNVVIASLPSGNYGTNPAASVAGQMKRTFPSLRFGLLVGIGGGVPRLTADDPADIRLGDVVVSDPTYHTGGVVQYDRGRTNEGEQRPERTGTLNKPPESLLTAVLGLKASQRFKDHPLECHLAQMIRRHSRLAPEYTYQGVDNDILFEAGYKHVGRGSSCAECSKSKCISRPHRRSTSPSIHYGTIASGNQVVKDSVTRDYWRDEEGILCFEMEAAGLMDSFPCLVIRGICDYADSHKNMRWQPYAAATAAAYAKDLLLEIAPAAVVATDSPFEGQLELGAYYIFSFIEGHERHNATSVDWCTLAIRNISCLVEGRASERKLKKCRESLQLPRKKRRLALIR